MTNLLKPAPLPDVRRDYTLTPSRELDSMVEIGTAGADVLIDEAKILGIIERTDKAEPVWRRYLQTQEQASELERAVVERQLGEIALFRMVIAQHTGEEDKSQDIGAIQEVLFDYYSPELFQAALRQKIDMIASLDIPKELEYTRALLLDTLESHQDDGQATELEKPTDETLSQIGNWLHQQFDDLFDMIDADGRKKYDATSIAHYFQMALDSTPALRENGWVVEVVEREKSVISVHAADKKILIAKQRVATSEALKKVIVHEVFGHALRSAIAEENGIEVGQQGTATYARFEESLMIALEQCLAGEYKPERGIDHYLAVGLSVTEGLSKDEIARIFKTMHVLQKSKDGLTDDVLAKSHKATAEQIRRTFAGMTDVDDGIAYRKDIDYLHGLNDSWKLLNFIAEHNIIDTAMPWLLAAKFNPFEVNERAYVNKFIPMPQELEAFFLNVDEREKEAA